MAGSSSQLPICSACLIGETGPRAEGVGRRAAQAAQPSLGWGPCPHVLMRVWGGELRNSPRRKRQEPQVAFWDVPNPKRTKCIGQRATLSCLNEPEGECEIAPSTPATRGTITRRR